MNIPLPARNVKPVGSGSGLYQRVLREAARRGLSAKIQGAVKIATFITPSAQ